MLMIFWFMIAIACAVIAAHRRRSAIGWFFIGLFFSLIGLIVLIAIPPGEPPQDRDEVPCPFCAEPVKRAAVKCRHCGSEIAPKILNTPVRVVKRPTSDS